MTSLWLTFVLKQGGATPLILVQAPNQAYFDQVRKGATTMGFRAVTPEQLAAGAWPAAPLVDVDVSDEGELVRVHLRTIDKSIVPSEPEPMTALWMVAAKTGGKTLVGLVPPGSLADDITEDNLVEHLGRVAATRRLYLGLGEFHHGRFRRRDRPDVPAVAS